MASSKFRFLILFLLTFSLTLVQSHEEAYIKAEISSRGLDFIKDLLIEKAETSLVPLDLPEIAKSVKIPLIGKVKMILSNITIERIDVSSSTAGTGDYEIFLDVSGATANLSMNWKYSYRARFIPIAISDQGNAAVQVQGLEVGLKLSLKTVEGSLKLSLMECGCYVNGISIKLDGGASWLYQGLVDAFEGKIGSAVEDAISKKIKDTIPKLDSLLESIPKVVPVTSIASLNVTFIDDPALSESSVDLEVNGLFYNKHEVALPQNYRVLLEDSLSCKEADKMVKISVHEDVFKSISSIYFRAGKMHWIVHRIPNESLLNTSGWKTIIPELYEMYPNRAMNLNLSVPSPPTIKVDKNQLMVTVPLDMVIDVLDVEEVIPVACISTVISSSMFAEISKETLSGAVKLNDIVLNLEWSKVVDLPMHQIQTLTSTVLKTTLLPYINSKLNKGYKVPVFHGYGLQNAHIVFTDTWILMYSDVAAMNQFSFI